MADTITPWQIEEELTSDRMNLMVDEIEQADTSIADSLEAHKTDFMPHGVNNAGFHNSVYRGKFLGNAVSAEQYANIQNGTFKDMYIGDYWTINGNDYVIAAFNYYTGVHYATDNHITLVPRIALYNHVMNDTNITTDGYTGSQMYTTGLNQAKATIKAAFGSRIFNHKKLLCNATTNGQANGWAFIDSEIDLMNEVMVYGSAVWGMSNIGGSGYNIGEGKTQLPLFRHRIDMISMTSHGIWLRDVVSATDFALVSDGGVAGFTGAAASIGVRPAFSIY